MSVLTDGAEPGGQELHVEKKETRQGNKSSNKCQKVIDLTLSSFLLQRLHNLSYENTLHSFIRLE